MNLLRIIQKNIKLVIFIFSQNNNLVYNFKIRNSIVYTKDFRLNI